MSILTGKHGNVLANGQPLAEITLWTFKTTRKHVAFSSSATGGFRRRLPGVREGSGRFNFVVASSQAAGAAIQEGIDVTLTLIIDRQRQYVVPAVIDVVAVETDISGGGPVIGWAEFSTTGAWTEPESE
ncbi:MAG: hypothetical protein K8T91_17790 [Planctomycetes bacterium]|nr:hypothetical protein [Planctomycetota bacterium]